MTAGRPEIVTQLADRLANLKIDGPRRVAVDGRTASGKTTLADELAVSLTQHGLAVIRTSIDGFHRPRSERYARGRMSPEGYYFDARDLSAIQAMLLEPLGPGGNGLYRTASFDLQKDVKLDQPAQLAPKDAILIVDGTFLQRGELKSGWDATIFVQVSEQISMQRGSARDTDLLGGSEVAERVYRERYVPAFALYERLHRPAEQADAVLSNDDFQHPALHIRADGRL